MASVAGWYADPTGKNELRYWDGSTWTERTKNRTNEEGVSAPKTKPKTAVTPKQPRQRSEICVIDWVWMNTRATDRRTRKDFPYEIWFVANALGPTGLYRTAESSITFSNSYNSYYRSGAFPIYRGASVLPRDESSEASFNDLVKQLWDAGWEPASGGGKGNLWYEYRFRRAVTG